MNISLTADKEIVKKGETINYTLKISSDEPLSDVIAEIIPSAEDFPEANIIPMDFENENGIFRIDVGDLSPDIKINFKGEVIKSFDKNTTAVIVTSDNNGSREAYGQVTISSHSLPLAVPVICSLLLITVSAFLIKQFI